MSIKEDIQVNEISPLDELAIAIAEKIGNCKVVDSCVYYLAEDFEAWDGDDDYKEVPFGIFFIIEVKEDSIIIYNSKPDTIEETEEIGNKPLSYFTGAVAAECKNVAELVSWLDNYMGRGWFSDDEAEFIDTYGGNTDEEN